MKFLVHGDQSPIPQAHTPGPEVYPLCSALEDIWSFHPRVPSRLPSYTLPTLQGSAPVPFLQAALLAKLRVFPNSQRSSRVGVPRPLLPSSSILPWKTFYPHGDH